MANSRLCSITDCGKPHIARGWCDAHYKRWHLLGDPLAGGPIGTAKGEALRFYREVVLAYDGDECLPWPYNRVGLGYGEITIDKKKYYVHRLVCEEENGVPPSPIHHAAHSCGKGHLGCVTRRHLSWKTPVENEADKIIHGTRKRRSSLPAL